MPDSIHKEVLIEVQEDLDLLHHNLRTRTANMSAEQLHLLMIVVRDWTNKRFGEKMRGEILQRYAAEAAQSARG